MVRAPVLPRRGLFRSAPQPIGMRRGPALPPIQGRTCCFEQGSNPGVMVYSWPFFAITDPIKMPALSKVPTRGQEGSTGDMRGQIIGEDERERKWAYVCLCAL